MRREQRTSELERRVAVLDAALRDAAHARLPELAAAFVRVMSAVSFRGTPDGDVERATAERADEVASRSLMLARLLELAPWMTAGPNSDECEQVWIATQRPEWQSPARSIPTRDDFVTPSTLPNDLTKRPLAFGLYTSSANTEYRGMWDTFVRQNTTDALWRRPWITWRLGIAGTPRIYNITTARDWVALVERYPYMDEKWVHADWSKIGENYAGVHISPSAVFAVEGLAVSSQYGDIAPTYWDVESTIWLRWCFESIVSVSSD